MPIKSKKTKLLTALRKILYEYRENIHRTRVNTCALCIEYIVDSDYRHECSACPMVVFLPTQIDYPCQTRKCHPVDYTSLDKSWSELKRVISFYEKIIEKIESMSTDAVRKSSFKFLIKIDKEVYDNIL